jgi:hypothetical protein
VPSVQHPEADTSPNGVNTQDVDVEADANTISGPPLDPEWSEQEYEQARRAFFEQGSRYAVLPVEIITDPRFTKHATVLIAMAAMSTLAVGDMLMVSQTQLARRLGVTQQAMSKTMAKAEEFGYVQRLAGPTTQARWRLRWLTSRRPQPQVVSSQAEVVSPQPQVVSSSRTHALSPVLSSTSSSVKSSSRQLMVTEEERAWLHARYDARIGPTFVDEQIELCLGYKTTKNHKNLKLACSNWLVKACEQVDRARTAKTNKELAETRYRLAKGEPASDPKVSEPAPFLTHSAADLPPFHDYTKD